MTHQTKDHTGTDQAQIFRFKYFVFFQFLQILEPKQDLDQYTWNNKGGDFVAVHLTCLGRPREGEMAEI